MAAIGTMNDQAGVVQLIPDDFGQGWMTDSARDLAKIAVALGGFDARELALRLARAPSRGGSINAATVEKVLDAMYREVPPERERTP